MIKAYVAGVPAIPLSHGGALTLDALSVDAAGCETFVPDGSATVKTVSFRTSAVTARHRKPFARYAIQASCESHRAS